jgi:hypothetical protein
MMRSLYRCLLWLHPLQFREEFAGEMLWIFDEAAETVGVVPLFEDALWLLLRQWVIRSGVWKFGAGAMLSGTFWMALYFGPQLFQVAPPQPFRSHAEAVGPPVHYRLYLVVEKPVWDARNRTTRPRP